MGAYFLRKVLLALLLAWAVLTLTFLLVEAIPGDYCDALVDPRASNPGVSRATLGCDEPSGVRYLKYLAAMTSGSLGTSVTQHRPVTTMIAEALPNTFQLALVSLFFSQAAGIAIGVVQAVRQHRWQDTTLSALTLFFYSIPGFWLALMLQLLFCLLLGWLPASGLHDPVVYDFLPPAQQFLDRLRHLLLPAFALTVASTAADARYVRASVLDVIRQDYIRTARAKGLPERKVILKHALRNALIPIVTLLGLNLPVLFSGSVLVETVFAWPGMGRLIVSAIGEQDTPLIMGCFLIYSLLVAVGGLATDLLYTLVDPNVRLD